jgi:molybdopterin/thiamine biosynthesis adenylyltransferase
MEKLHALARTETRSGYTFHIISHQDLHTFARGQNLTIRQATAAALRTGVFPECFERNFPSLSGPEQWRLFDSSVLVVGLGGLGGMLALLLARVGVGRLLLADGDVFLPANLNRQVLATDQTLGQNKVQVAATHIQQINPALLVEAIADYLDPDNLPTYLSQVQVAADGLDSLKSRRHLFEAAQTTGVPLVHGAVLGRYGQVATILPVDPDTFSKIYSDATPEVEGGREILAPVAALIASLQAQEVIRVLLGQTPAYRGRLAHFDGDTGTLEILPLW